MTTKRHRKLVIVVSAGGGLIVAALAYFVVTGVWIRLFGPHVTSDRMVGRSESRITREYGSPVQDWAKYADPAALNPEGLPPGPIRTVIYEPRGLLHLEGGTLWVWYRQTDDGSWVCFRSLWFERHVKF